MTTLKSTTSHRSTKLAAAMALVLALAVAAIALAQGTGSSTSAEDLEFSGDGFGSRFGALAARLDLSSEQEEAIAAIRSEGRQKSFEVHKQIMRLRNELEGEMLAEVPREETLVDLTEKIGQLRTELQVEKMRSKLAIGRELTAAQRDKLLMMRNSRRGGGDRGCSGSRGGAEGRSGRNGRGGCGRGHGHHGAGAAECDGEGPKGPHGRGGQDRDR